MENQMRKELSDRRKREIEELKKPISSPKLSQIRQERIEVTKKPTISTAKTIKRKKRTSYDANDPLAPALNYKPQKTVTISKAPSKASSSQRSDIQVVITTNESPLPRDK